MTDHQAEVERLLAEYRRSREQLAAVHRALAGISITQTSRDGTVTATVGAQGTLTALDIAADAYRQYRPSELAELIVRLTAAAAGQATAEAQRVLEPVLPAAADPAAVLAGTADLRPDEIGPIGDGSDSSDGSGASDGEEELDEQTWLEQALRGRRT